MHLMKPAHRSVMTPQPLSCVMHHVLLPSVPERACQCASSRAPPEPSPRLKRRCDRGRGREWPYLMLLQLLKLWEASFRYLGLLRQPFLSPSDAIARRMSEAVSVRVDSKERLLSMQDFIW